MKSKIKITLFAIMLLAIVLSTTGCNSALTAKDNGTAVTVKTGDTFTVKLEGNPSTGYTWETKDLDTSLLEQVGEAEFSGGVPGMVGSGGNLTLTFKAQQPGTTTLTLVYHRPWEKDVEPIDTFSVAVTVK